MQNHYPAMRYEGNPFPSSRFARVRSALRSEGGRPAYPLPQEGGRCAASGGCRFASTQRGAALVVALILLAVITLVGLAAIGTTLIQNKAAANAYDRQIAFQSTEAALREGQNKITTTATPTTPAPTGIEDCSTPDGSSTPVNVCLANPFKDTNANVTIVPVPATGSSSAFDAGALAAAQPQYVVQYMGQFRAPTPKTRSITGSPPSYGVVSGGELADYYRITARSGDPQNANVDGRAIVTLQSTFRN